LAGRQGHTSGQLLYVNAEFSINAEAKDRDVGIAGMRGNIDLASCVRLSSGTGANGRVWRQR